MKKSEPKKLNLHRETILALEQADLREVAAAATANTCFRTCTSNGPSIC
jgi:hypothetical protein